MNIGKSVKRFLAKLVLLSLMTLMLFGIYLDGGGAAAAVVAIGLAAAACSFVWALSVLLFSE